MRIRSGLVPDENPVRTSGRPVTLTEAGCQGVKADDDRARLRAASSREPSR